MVLVTLLANSTLTYLNLRRLNHNERLVQHSNEVLLALQSLQATLVDAETGQRGYLITGQPAYLKPYDVAVAMVDSELQNVQLLTADNPSQQAHLEQLEVQVAQRLERFRTSIAVRTKDGFEPARDIVATGQGKIAMDEIRRGLAKMQAEERQILATRASESNTSFWTAVVTSWITLGLGLAMVVVGYSMVNRDLDRREHLANAMQKNVATLEDRVQVRTREITEANTFLREEVLERRRAEDLARAVTEELRRSNRELEQFASVASHDLQEPLRKIQAFGDRLRERCRDQLAEQGRDFLDRMLASASRMRNLINDLLAYSRVSSKSQPYAAVDLHQVALEVTIDLEARLQQTGGQVELGELPVIDADPTQMRQLLQNLIGNALKFRRAETPPEVQVFSRVVSRTPSPVDGEALGLHCEITVQDNGIGFEQVYVDRIFELFQRLHGREEYEGTGMGLAICRKIVDRHGGRITAESSPGQGARFIVTLPIRQTNSGTAA
ncbi:MAG TPA: CHASE3 domain-containing protein [Pirellulaceae bacterium]|nr:CHASE3 domain-containing protein [Pirellulaceae bacterium]